MSGEMTSVLVADERQMVAETLQRVIDAEPDLTVRSAFTCHAALLDVVAATAPDVVVLGGDFGGDGVTVARRVREQQPATQVVMLIDDMGVTSALDAIAAGCIGVVSADRGAEDLCNAIRSAAGCTRSRRWPSSTACSAVRVRATTAWIAPDSRAGSSRCCN